LQYGTSYDKYGKYEKSKRRKLEKISGGEEMNEKIFESYYEADSSGKIELIRKMTVKAVKKIKAKGKFDWERFRDDLMGFLD